MYVAIYVYFARRMTFMKIMDTNCNLISKKNEFNQKV